MHFWVPDLLRSTVGAVTHPHTTGVDHADFARYAWMAS
ncbi:hypothetical protein [Streptomyces phage phiScoe15]|nr:hypothetical protein [Streptomyces phage phiScoe15]